MNRRLPIPILIFIIISSSCGRNIRDTYGVERVSLEHSGRTRTCLIHLPKKIPAGKLPLLIVLHGGGGNAAGMLRLTGKKFNFLADDRGFIVAHPEGIGGHWNDFRDDPIDYSHKEKVDDTGFISALIDKLAAEYPVDARRVF